MAIFTITAHQEMFAQVDIEAPNAHEARSLFLWLLNEDKVQWHKGDEDCEIDEVMRSRDVIQSA